MDITDSPEAAAFRAQFKQFLAEQLPADWPGIGALDHDESLAFCESWRKTLQAHRYLAVAWPREYGGGGLTKLHHVIVVEECARARVPIGIPGDTYNIKLLGNTLLKWGTEEQKQHMLPRILSGEDRWCQGYSEPDSGSDLASVKTTAVRDGDEWVINGQKIWTSHASKSNHIFLLARTNPAASKTRGISFLLAPLDTPGIEVREIRQSDNLYDLCEVFFTDARIPVSSMLGPVDEGWTVANSLLGHERGEEAATNPINFRHELDRLIALARQYGRIDDPLVRDRLAWCYTKVEIMKAMGYRILTGYLRDGVLGPEASISKLYWSEYHVAASNLAMDIMGIGGLVEQGRIPTRWYRTDDPGAPNDTASWIHMFLFNALAGTVYAGSSQVQRNILGESVLGLPREPRPS
ncbi:MAG: acyl-CoA dehydrogenase family protein [Acidimicrobiia bacterium]